MRKLAQKKANALIQSLPLGVVMVDDKLNVIECNEQFARLCGKDVEEIYKTSGLEGAMLSRLVPFDYLFSGVLSTGERIVGRELFYDGRVFRITVFPVEQKRIAGAVLADITEPAVAREAVLERTQAVIDKQINTVQRIAYLLGENAAETETLLRSLSSAFSIKKGE